MEEKSHSVEPYAIGAEERQHHDDRRGRGGGGGGGSLGDDDSDDIDDNKDDVHESQHRMSSSYKQSHCSVASRSVASPKKKRGRQFDETSAECSVFLAPWEIEGEGKQGTGTDASMA